MKYVAPILGALLGLLFVASGLVVLLKLAPMPTLPEGTPQAMFMGAIGPTGYLTFVKVCEVLGGILVAIPRTRNFGLLILGPILINILAFHIFINGGKTLDPVTIIAALIALYLLWDGRKAFGGLLRTRSRPSREPVVSAAV